MSLPFFPTPFYASTTLLLIWLGRGGHMGVRELKRGWAGATKHYFMHVSGRTAGYTLSKRRKAYSKTLYSPSLPLRGCLLSLLLFYINLFTSLLFFPRILVACERNNYPLCRSVSSSVGWQHFALSAFTGNFQVTARMIFSLLHQCPCLPSRARDLFSPGPTLCQAQNPN